MEFHVQTKGDCFVGKNCVGITQSGHMCCEKSSTNGPWWHMWVAQLTMWKMFLTKLHLKCSKWYFWLFNIYHLRVGVRNNFSHVCLSVCPSVCLSVCVSLFPSVQVITFQPLHIKTSFLVCRHIFTISTSNLSIKVIRSRSYEKNDNFTNFNMLILYLLHVINKVKITHQCEGHTKVKAKISTSFPIVCQLLLISTH